MRLGARELLFFLVLAVVPVAAYFLVFQPRNVQVAQAREEISAKQNRLEALDNTEAKVGDLQSQIEELEVLITESRERLPSEALIDQIVRDITASALETGLKTEKIRSQDTTSTPNWVEHRMNIVMVGDFKNFYTFLLNLQEMQRVTKISKIKITKSVGNQQDSGQMRVDFVLSLFCDAAPDAAISK